MVAVRQDLPEVFTPGFSQLLDQGCSAGQQTPGTPPDSTAMLEPTVALLSSAQLAQAGQVHDVHAMLLSDSTAQPPQEPARSSNTTSSSTGTGTAAARARVSMSQGDSSRRQTLPEVEETSAAAHSKATPAAEQLQAEESPVAAEDVQVDVDMADAPVSCIASGSSSSPMPAEVPEASNLTAADADEQQSNSTTAVAAGGSRDVSAAAEVPAASTPLEDSTAQQATALTVVPATADTMLGSPAQASAGPASPAPQADATAADAGDEAEVATAAQGPVGLPADCKSSSEADACSANTATEAAQADEAPAPAEQAPVPDAAACPAEEDRAASPQQPHAENSSSSRSPDCSAGERAVMLGVGWRLTVSPPPGVVIACRTWCQSMVCRISSVVVSCHFNLPPCPEHCVFVCLLDVLQKQSCLQLLSSQQPHAALRAMPPLELLPSPAVSRWTWQQTLLCLQPCSLNSSSLDRPRLSLMLQRQRQWLCLAARQHLLSLISSCAAQRPAHLHLQRLLLLQPPQMQPHHWMSTHRSRCLSSNLAT